MSFPRLYRSRGFRRGFQPPTWLCTFSGHSLHLGCCSDPLQGFCGGGAGDVYQYSSGALNGGPYEADINHLISGTCIWTVSLGSIVWFHGGCTGPATQGPALTIQYSCHDANPWDIDVSFCLSLKQPLFRYVGGVRGQRVFTNQQTTLGCPKVAGVPTGNFLGSGGTLTIEACA